MRIIRLALLTLCVLFCYCTQAQKGSIKGVLKDSATKESLNLASVTVFTAKDTSIITYRLSDPSGGFHVTGIPLHIVCRAVVTFQGYKVYRKEFELTKENQHLDLGAILLTNDTAMLEEVLVVAERPPVAMRNDTLEFNASAFKTLPGALLEDLLKKLPGVDVDLDGNITVKGKRVNRLLVDGKQFFGGDHNIATKNLPSNIVDKVQVTDDKEELENNPLLSKDEVGQVVNIKLKRAIKQGWFGKAYAGGGTDNRHEAGAIVNLFRDTTQISFLGHSNNVNKPGFSMSDLNQFGGFNRNGGGTTTYGGPGITHSTGGGMNFNTLTSKKVKLNLQYFYGRTTSGYEQVSNNQQFLKDTILTTPSVNRSRSINKNHRVAGSIDWDIDSVTRLNFRPNLSISNSLSDGYNNRSTTDNFKGLVNQNENNNEAIGSSFNYYHSLGFNRASRKNQRRHFNANISLSIYDNNSNQLSEGLYSLYKSGIRNDSAINQLRDMASRSLRSRNNFSFTEPLSQKANLIVTHSSEYMEEKNLQDFYTLRSPSGEYSLYVEELSNGVERKGWQHSSAATVSLQLKNFRLSPGVNFLLLDRTNSFMRNPSVDQLYFYTYPSLEIGWKRFSLRYSVNVSEPPASNLQEVIDISNPLYKRYGNPNLKPSYSRTASLSFFTFSPKSGSSFNFNINGTFTDNTVLNETTLDNNRVSISRPLNADGTSNFYGSGGYNRQLKLHSNFRMSLAPHFNLGYNTNFVSINGNRSRAYTTYASMRFAVLLNVKDIIELNQHYSANYNRSTYEDTKNYPKREIVTHTAGSDLALRWPRNVVWENQLDYTYNPQVSPGIRKSTVRWNAGLNYMFLKDNKGQIKLSVYDVLKQNVNIFRYISESSITDAQTATLQRYFMLSLIYNIRTFSSGPKPKTTRNVIVY
jgi:hypothetical protein